VFVPEPGLSQVAALSSTGSLQQNIAVPNNPVYVVAVDGARRAYAISQGGGTVSSIEAGNLAVSSTIGVGANPVYGVMTADGTRAFILNQGSGTVSVINVINNGQDMAMPTIPASGTLGQNPVWADLSPVTSELVVLNAGDGVHPGSLSIISIPLCSAIAQASNPNCNFANPVDATGFGAVVATVPVGINPTMVSVLQDGTKAYVANAGNATAGVEGSVSVVNLASGTILATIPAVSSASATVDTTTTPGAVYGHPGTISATTGSPTGRVYVTSPDNKYLTVIETDTNTVLTHINLQGLGVRVLVSAP
jgi:DNA-binding beta-propeller fold protein YncE